MGRGGASEREAFFILSHHVFFFLIAHFIAFSLELKLDGKVNLILR